MISALEDVVSNEEIKKAIWDCGSAKSPGPDGFTFEFFKRFWSIVGGDVINAIKEFFISSTFLNGCNPSFIALIPKVLDAKHLNDFHPISLIGCQYKIIGKILANRLRLVIDEIISHEQTAFIKDIQNMADKFGCMASVLVNGSPTEEFLFHRGLRQGDPLSPFLFILVMESLHVSLQRLIDRGMFIPISVGKDKVVSISHLFYADDAIFIGRWSSSNVNVLMMMLHCFSLASGLKINVHKSSLNGVGISYSDIQNMADKHKTRTRLSPPFLFILVMKSLHVSLQRLIDRGMFIPISVGKDKVVSISHLFYADDAIFIGRWSSSNVNVLMMMLHCFSLASGLKINVHKSSLNGVGISYSDIQNMADKFGCMANNLPFTYLGVKVGSNMSRINAWDDIVQKGLVVCSLLIVVLKAIDSLKSRGVDLMKFCNKVIGNGNNSKFWQDKWLGQVCFKDKFHRLFNLELQKDVSVLNKLIDQNLTLTFRRRPRAGIEESQLLELSQLLSSVTLSSAKDRWTWNLNGHGVFSVKSAREEIDSHLLVTSSS
ncbi:RNA-directed DNA polymerase, eukaryota [Tanacetum coccineum]